MTLKKGKYKLTLYHENECPDCNELKKLLDENDISYINKCITVDDKLPTNQKMINTNNRWEFHDFAKEHPKEFRFAPVLVIEDEEFNYEFISVGHHFETGKPEQAVKIIEEKYQQ